MSALDPEHRATVLTVLNLKGGVGKSHTAWLLAAVAQERGRRLLAVDLDTQGNLSTSFLPEPDGRPGVEALFDVTADPDPAALVRSTAFRHIDVIPAGPALARHDLSDRREWERADLHLSLVDAVESLRARHDLIVLDCPPRLSLVSFAALCASDVVLIPLEAADWGAQGVTQVAAAVEHVRQRYNPRLSLLGYLVSRFKRARAYQQVYMKRLREQFGDLAFDTVVPDRARFEQSVCNRTPVTLLAPRSPEADIARHLFDEVVARIENRRDGRDTGVRSRTPAAV